MNLTLSECTDKNRWDRFVAASPHGSIFCVTSFLDGLGEDYQLLLVEEGGEALGGVLLHLRDGQPCSGQCIFGIYQGVLLRPNVRGEPPHRRVRGSVHLLAFLLAELEKRYPRI